MSAILVAGPAVEPVTLAEAKAHLRLDSGDEDALVASLVAAARHTLELATRRAFVAQTWRLRLDRWPEGRAVALPLAPLIAIVAVRVSPLSGPAATVDPGTYRIVREADPPTLTVDAAVADAGLPSGGIEIDATYGFGAAATDVPQPLRLAIQRLVARWFERRGDGDDAVMPADVAALVRPFVRPRLA
jgi:uncharacterized phiE125 gp8 family phage protein